MAIHRDSFMTMHERVAGNPARWYHAPFVILIAILAIGPFAIPLVWISARFKFWHKVFITVLIIMFTVWAANESIKAYRSLSKQIQNLQAVLKN